MKKSKVVYDSVGDILYVGDSKGVKNSLQIMVGSGPIIVEIDKESMIQAIEIMNAGSFFNKSIADLDKVKAGFLQAVHTPNYTSLNVTLELENEIIGNTIDIPYSEKLFLSSN